MNIKRKITRVDTPSPHQGFLGPDHTARAVIQNGFQESDPFILLMDDYLDKKDNEPVGGPHPHAGFETVSLLIEGSIGEMHAGDLQLMTAGSGVIHTETIEHKAKMRLLQLWLTLPKADRWTPPRLQDLKAEHVPSTNGDGFNIKVYSGSFAGISSPINNYVPMIIADIQMDSGKTMLQNIPSDYTTFLYVLEGSVKVGEDEKIVHTNQVGWLDKFQKQGMGELGKGRNGEWTDNFANSELKITAGEKGARFVLYSAQPQGDPIVSHGPFIGDTQQDIIRLYDEYRQGKMKFITDVDEDHLIKY